MTDIIQSNLRMPQVGEGWRHYKGGSESLYEIVGVGYDAETGSAIVGYKAYGRPLTQTPLHTRRLDIFLSTVKVPRQTVIDSYEFVPRFRYDRGP